MPTANAFTKPTIEVVFATYNVERVLAQQIGSIQ